jgi:hypothetical protein
LEKKLHVSTCKKSSPVSIYLCTELQILQEDLQNLVFSSFFTAFYLWMVQIMYLVTTRDLQDVAELLQEQ